jgi:VWFA-related protein
MKLTSTFAAVFAAAAFSAVPLHVIAQSPDDAPGAQDQHPSTISVRSNLVLVPALVKTKAGANVYTLAAKDFILTDDGVPQPLRMEADAGGEPLAMVVLVQSGNDGATHLNELQALIPTLEAVIGGVKHKTAVVSFDSQPQLEQGFTSKNEDAWTALNRLDAGDSGAAMLDALTYSVDMLRKMPPSYRRVIVLISQTIDHGSHIKVDEALRQLDDTNTTVYSLAFTSTMKDFNKDAGNLDSATPNPAHGCFSHDPNSTVSRARQNYNCVAQLLPPIELVRLAFVAAIDGLKRNTAETVAKLTGGEYFHEKNVRSMEKSLLAISNHLPNRYVLSFRPQSPSPGFHALQLKLKNYDNLVVEARNGYWVEDDGSQETVKP